MSKEFYKICKKLNLSKKDKKMFKRVFTSPPSEPIQTLCTSSLFISPKDMPVGTSSLFFSHAKLPGEIPQSLTYII